MLRSLHIRNFVLIDSLDVEFPEGLVIITGQTGAGKSILLGALGLLAGDKAEAGLIRSGAENCVVEGIFDTPEGERIIRRVIYSSGRSRSFIDDCPVQLQELSELGGRLFDIHSQHQSLLLTDRQFQLGLLDRYAATKPLADECRQVWEQLGACLARLSQAREEDARNRSESDYNSAQLRELESAGLRDGEFEELEEEQLTLGNAEEIRERLQTVLEAFGSADGSGASVRESLQTAKKALEHVSKYLPSASSLSERIDSARIELDDIFGEVEDAAGRIDTSPQRLSQVEERLSLLYRLMSKHGCSDIAGLIEVRERYRSMAESAEGLDERIEALVKESEALRSRHAGICSALHLKRAEAAKGFSEEVTAGLAFLELERASFRVALNPATPSASGADAVEFLFSSDGSRGVEIAKCASGGELSRIMLSLKALMARYEGMPTLIFDEIDTGVSGSVADRMGQMICRMGESMQVFSITHLPQVAAKGSAHYLVSKTFDPASGRSTSGITLLEGEDRIREIARLLSGESITREAMANARALLEEKA